MSPRTTASAAGAAGSAGSAAATPSVHRVSARELALTVVRDVFGPERRAAQAAFAVRARRTTLDVRDRAFAADLAYGAIKMRRLLDWYLAPYLGDRRTTLPPTIGEILRLGAHQLLVMSGVDDHAAVYETVNLANRHGHRGTAGLVNAVLRRIATERPAPPERADCTSDDEFLGLLHSLPTWVVARLRAAFPERIDDVLTGLAGAPQRAVRVNPRVAAVDDVRAALRETGIVTEPSRFVDDVLIGTGATPDDPDGRFVVQGEASAIPVAWLAPVAGERVADFCAGRGHKSAQIGAAMDDRGEVFCVERDARKRTTLERALADARVSIGAIVIGDAREPLDLGTLDAALVDAPCSGLGILGRHPEARWRKEPGDGERLAETQRAILDRAAERVRVGGRIVYSVCSTDAVEGTAVVDAFLARHAGWRRGDVPERLAAFATGDGTLVVPPGIEGRDGFTIARLEHAAD